MMLSNRFKVFSLATSKITQAAFSETKVVAGKRTPNPFILFFVDQRPTFKANNPELKTTEISKALGAEWSSLSLEAKEVYIKKSEELKSQIPIPEAKVVAGKRTTNPFFLFLVDQRPTFKANNPELKTTEISKALGAEWSSLSLEAKEVYIKKSEELKSQIPIPGQGGGWTFDETQALSSKKETKSNRKPKKVQKEFDEIKSKLTKPRPLPAYFHFAAKRRPVLKLENPTMLPVEVTKALAAEWKALDPVQKQAYTNKI